MSLLTAVSNRLSGEKWPRQGFAPGASIIMHTQSRKIDEEFASETRDRMLLAVAQSTAQLVSATSVSAAMAGALETIGNGLGADRVLVTENRRSDLAHPIALVGIWQRTDVPVKVDAELFLNPVVMSPEIGCWLNPLAEGETVFASAGDVDGAVARFLDLIQTKSILFVPILIDGKWWGSVSIDDCRLGRTWPTAEIDALKTFAEIVGASTTRERHMTALKQTELALSESNKALQESERKFRNVFQQTFQLMGIVATDGTLLDANRTALEYAGQNARDILGKPIWEVRWWSYPPELQAKLRDAIARAANGELVRFEVERKAADGTVQYNDVSLKPVKDEGGTVVFLIAEGYDITERKKAVQQLQEEEEKYRSLVEQDIAGTFIVGEDGTITYANPYFAKLVGHTPAEVLGHPFLEYVVNVDRHSVQEQFAELIQGQPWPLQIVAGLRQKSGGAIDVLFQSNRARHRGRPAVIGVLIDISERKRAEHTMQRLNRTLRTLSAANKALVRARNEQELLHRMCSVIVEVGGYRMAWIGMAEHDADRTVRPVAWAGHNAGYVEKAKLSWADTERGYSPGGRAVREGVPQVAQDIMEPRFAPWRADALARGYMSTAGFPLKDASGAFGVLCIYATESDAFTAGEVGLLTELANDLSFGIIALRTRAEREEGVRRLRRAMESVVQALANMAERRDPYTAGHQLRTARLAAAIARELGLSDERTHGIYMAGVIHDVGKVAVPAEILSKTGKLTPAEFALVKEHAQAGYEIVKDIDFPWPVGRTILQHHERLDGSGYPNGLKRDAILPEAKILAVADVVEAMTSHRPYRPALGLDTALAEIEKGKGRLYDAAAVNACIKLFKQEGFDFEES